MLETPFIPVMPKRIVNPKKEVAILELGEAISNYLPPHHPSPYSSDNEPKDYVAMLRDIRLLTKKVRQYIYLQTAYEPIRITLKQGGIDPLKVNDPQVLPDSYIQGIALAAYADLISTNDYTSTDHFANLLSPLMSEESGSYIEGKLQARLIMSELVAKNILLISERFIILPARLREMLAGGNALNRPNLEEKHVKWFRMARQKEKDTQNAKNPQTNNANAKPNAPLNSPHAIYMRLKEFVIGNDYAVRQLAVRGFLHLQRRELLKAKQDAGSNECILFMGESGTGKTYLVENFGKLCGLPFASMNSSSFSSSGYVGLDPEDAIKSLIRNAGDAQQQATLEKARYGVLFLDEWDKRKAHSTTGLDVTGSNIQYEFLRLISGAVTPLLAKRSESETYPAEFNSNGTLFTFAGAFTGLDEILKRLNKDESGMGFGGSEISNFRNSAKLYDALLDYGMVAEFLNRVTAIITMTAPDRNTLVKIATSSHGDIQIYNRILGKQGLNLSIDAKGLMGMADFCVETKLYARGIRLVVSSLVEEAVFNQITGSVSFGLKDVRGAIDRVSGA